MKRIMKHLMATKWTVKRAFPADTLIAIDVFSQLRIWDTEHNNGILIYLLLADRDAEIVADRGIDAKVGAEEWERTCRRMESAFRQGDFEAGVVGGIQEVTRHLAGHFPPVGDDRNELPDKPVLL